MELLFNIAVVSAVIGVLCGALAVSDAVFGFCWERFCAVRRFFNTIMCVEKESDEACTK